MNDLICDWNRLIENEISLDEFVRVHWEAFKGVYIKTMRTKDDSDLYLKLYTLVEKMLKLDVVPIFEHPSQIFQYFKYYRINEAKAKKVNCVSLDYLAEENNLEFSYSNDYRKDDLELNQLLCEIEKQVSPLQMTTIMLLLKGYSRKEISEILGTSKSVIYNRLYQTKEIIQNIIKN